MEKIFYKDKLRVCISDNRHDMGDKAGKEIAVKLRELLAEKKEVNIIFAAAPSQNEVLKRLVLEEGIEWNRVNAFHMDEYIGLKADAPQSFGRFLDLAIFKKVDFKTVNYINGSSPDINEECKRYSELLQKYPTDIVCLGIGENGHIAFNDPPVADFNDDKLIKPVKLDEICRNQQVHDGCFDNIKLVPTHALTLTIPTLFRANYLFCTVPAVTKAKAVFTMINGVISEACPASILRRHENANLYCDSDSASLLG